MRRLVDVLVSATALAVLAPLLLIVSIGVRVTLGSPILFRQQRPGLHGELFEIVKFRTMQDGDGNDAERLTRFGSLLRTTSLDELPELWNILRGEMTFVGPRPLLPEYLPHYSDRQATRHRVLPGLTGLAQVSGRNDLSWEERLELDAVYVETQSIRLDLWIVARTVQAVLRRKSVNQTGQATVERFVP